ncbi:MAG: DNA gyrase inhibitor YacG [Pseudohongiella sp.]|nr:DNA gyrase inhibitor YacG [Pseudohongiella sp.]
MSERVLRVNCPHCKEIVEWGEQSPWRPFCSERCKLIDFGEWANERHSIPGEPVDPEQLENMPNRSDEND